MVMIVLALWLTVFAASYFGASLGRAGRREIASLTFGFWMNYTAPD